MQNETFVKMCIWYLYHVRVERKPCSAEGVRALRRRAPVSMLRGDPGSGSPADRLSHPPSLSQPPPLSSTMSAPSAGAGPGPSTQAASARVRLPPDVGGSGRYKALGLGRPSVLRTFASTDEDDDERQRARSLDAFAASTDSSGAAVRNKVGPHPRSGTVRDRKRQTALAQAAAAAVGVEHQGPVRTLVSDDLGMLPYPSVCARELT
jgi:hypothetical protein